MRRAVGALFRIEDQSTHICDPDQVAFRLNALVKRNTELEIEINKKRGQNADTRTD